MDTPAWDDTIDTCVEPKLLPGAESKIALGKGPFGSDHYLDASAILRSPRPKYRLYLPHTATLHAI